MAESSTASYKSTVFDIVDEHNDVILKNITKSATDYIESKIKAANLNEAHLTELSDQVTNLDKKIKKNKASFFGSGWFKVVCGLLWTITVGLIFAFTIMQVESFQPAYVRWIILACLIVGFIGSLFLTIFGTIKGKQIKKDTSQMELESSQLKNECYQQLSPLFNSIHKKEIINLLESTVNWLTIDNIVTSPSLIHFADYFVFDKNTNLISGLYGKILTHPFALITTKTFKMIQKPYTGSTVVSVQHMENGHMVTSSQTVTATIYKPFPVYDKNTVFLYKMQGFPELKFKNENPIKHKLGLNQFYKKHPNQRKMENEKFDMLFPCIRNDEVAYRSLFTIYSQEQFIKAYENFQYKYLNVNKDNPQIVQIQADSYLNGLKTSFIVDEVLRNYDLEAFKDGFIDFIINTLSSVYQFAAPMLACSISQTQKYIDTVTPKSRYDKKLLSNLITQTNVSYFHKLANLLHPNTSTIVPDGLVKLSYISETNGASHFCLDVNSHRSERKVEYVTEFAEGQIVKVPVYYDEFYPVSKSYSVLMWQDKNHRELDQIDSIATDLKDLKLKSWSIHDGNGVAILDQYTKNINAKSILNGINKFLNKH